MHALELNISTEAGYVRVERPSGYTVVPERETTFLEWLVDSCKIARCRNVLLLGPSTSAQMTTFEILDLGAQIAATRLSIAVVEAHDVSPEDVEFLQNVVWNRGGAIRFFTSEDDAKNWLGVG